MSFDPLVPGDESYRTCSECGGDCEPDPTISEYAGSRITFVNREHGAQSVVDPFQNVR